MVRKNIKILIIGLDGADWKIIRKLLDNGKLPNLRKLIEGGVSANLKSLEPFISPVIWTSIFSGKSPDKHGIKDFFATGNNVRCKRVWDILTEKDLRVGIFEVMNTWPPRPVYGFWIPDTFARDARTFPETYDFIKKLLFYEKSGLKRGLLNYLMDAAKIKFNGVSFLTLFQAGMFFLKEKYLKINTLDKNFYKRVMRARIFSELFIALVRRFNTDLSIFYTNIIDVASHIFWKFYEPEKFSDVEEKNVARYGNYIPMAYVEADRILGKIVDKLARANHCVMVISDHGFRAVKDDPTWESYRIKTETLLKELNLWGFANPIYIGSRLFLKPKDENKEEYQRIINLLEGIKIKGEGGFSSLFNAGIDSEAYIKVELKENYPSKLKGHHLIFPNGKSISFEELVEPTGSHISGTHDKYGIFILKGPPFKTNHKIDEVTIFDITPTLLYLFGLPVAKDMDGNVIKEAFREEFLDKNPITYIESYEPQKRMEIERQEEVDEDVIQRLRDLGYI